MEVKLYDPIIEKWHFDTSNKFLGNNEASCQYGIGVTPPDPDNLDYCYVTVLPEFIIKNQTNGIVFNAVLRVVFGLKNKRGKPSHDVVFACCIKAFDLLNEIYKNRTEGSNLRPDYFSPPQLEDLVVPITQNINSVYKRPYK